MPALQETESTIVDPVAPSYAASQEERVLAALREHPEGLADFELEPLLGLTHSTLCPRRNALVKRGLVRDSKLKRLTPNGRPASVWVACVPGTGAPLVVPEPEPEAELPPQKTVKRLEFEQKMDGAAPLLRQGKSNVEIAAVLGVSESSVSNAKRALERDAKLPTKLDRDLDRFDATLPSTVQIARDLARRLGKESSTKTAEELKTCAKNLAESVRQLRGLQSVLKRLAS